MPLYKTNNILIAIVYFCIIIPFGLIYQIHNKLCNSKTSQIKFMDVKENAADFEELF